jgi:hypothetical protein
MRENRPKLNDFVRWGSQSQGSWKKKIGQIVQVVPAGEIPDRKIAPDLFRSSGIGLPRKHESYVVRVKTGKNSFRHYWPRVSGLSLTGRPAGEK